MRNTNLPNMCTIPNSKEEEQMILEALNEIGMTWHSGKHATKTEHLRRFTGDVGNCAISTTNSSHGTFGFMSAEVAKKSGNLVTPKKFCSQI